MLTLPTAGFLLVSTSSHSVVPEEDYVHSCSAGIFDSSDDAECLIYKSYMNSKATDANFPFWGKSEDHLVHPREEMKHRNRSLANQSHPSVALFKSTIEVLAPLPQVFSPPLDAHPYHKVYSCWYNQNQHHLDICTDRTHCQERCEPNEAKFHSMCCQTQPDGSVLVAPICEEENIPHNSKEGMNFGSAVAACKTQLTGGDLCTLAQLQEPNIWIPSNDMHCETLDMPNSFPYWTTTPCDQLTGTTITSTQIIPESEAYISRGCFDKDCPKDTNVAQCHERCQPKETMLAVACCEDNGNVYGVCQFRVNGARWEDAKESCKGIANTHICNPEELKSYYIDNFANSCSTTEDYDAQMPSWYTDALATAQITDEQWHEIANLQQPSDPLGWIAANPKPTGSVYSGIFNNYTIDKQYEFFPFWTNEPCTLPISTSKFSWTQDYVFDPNLNYDAYEMCRCEDDGQFPVDTMADTKAAQSVCGWYDPSTKKRSCERATFQGTCATAKQQPPGSLCSGASQIPKEYCTASSDPCYLTHDRFLRRSVREPAIHISVSNIAVVGIGGKKRCQPRNGQFMVRCCHTSGKTKSMCNYIDGTSYDHADYECQSEGHGWGLCSADMFKQGFSDGTSCGLDWERHLFWSSEPCTDEPELLSKTPDQETPAADMLFRKGHKAR